jgi:hypothetical protein
MLLPVEIDYGRPFTGSDYGVWEEEYLANVREPEPLLVERQPNSLMPEQKLSGLFGHQRNTTPFFDEFAPASDEDLWEEFLDFQEARHGE